MSDEQDKLKLSLEPPRLFGRKKKSDAAATAEPSPPPPTAPPEETAVEDDASPEPAAEGTLEPVAVTEADPPAEEEAAPQEPEPGPERRSPAKKAAAKSSEKTAKRTVRKAALPADQPAAEPAAATTAAAGAAAAPTTEVVDKPVRPRAKLAPDIEPEPVSRLDQEDAEIAAAADESPLLPPYPAAAVTGAVVGASMVLLIWVSLRGCEAVRGTATCTGGPGFLLLVTTFVLCVLLGSALLKVFSIPDPGSSSFLAVGLIAVVALLFLIEVLDHWSMLIVIPVVGAGAFLASVWVTRTFVEEVDTS